MADEVKYGNKKILENLLTKGRKVFPAGEELRVKLNEIISSHRLDTNAVTTLLAYLSAAYVHKVKQTLDTEEAKDLLEDIFVQDFNNFLIMFDLNDVMEEVEKMKKKELN